MPPIFKTPSGLPLAVYLEPSSSNRAASLRNIRANGGGICLKDSDADVVLVDADSPDGRLCARQMCTDPNSVVLFHEWINACIDAGKLLNAEFNWGSLRIQDAALVDESLYSKDDEAPAPALAKRSIKTEEQSNDHAASSQGPNGLLASPDHTKSFVSGGGPAATSLDGTLDDAERPLLSRNRSQPEEPASEKKHPDFPNPTIKVSSPFGHAPADPRLAELYFSACNQWEALKQSSGSTSPPRTGLLQPMGTVNQRGSSIDPLDLIATPDRVYEPLARRPRPSHEHGSDSTQRGPKRRKLSDHGLQKGLRSKGPPLVSVPGTGPQAGSGNKAATPIAPEALASSSTTPNPTQKPVFEFLGEALQFWLQVDLPDRGSVVRLIKRNGGKLAATMEAASYVIVSKAAPQYTEIVTEADAADRVAVPVAWVNQCIKTNKLVPVDDYAVGPPPGLESGSRSDQPADDASFAESEIVSAALAAKPPTPPGPSSTMGPSQGNSERHVFSAEDQVYLHRFLAWELYNNPSISINNICRDLAKNAPHHPYSSWLAFYYKSTRNDTHRVRRIVTELTS